MSGSFSAPDVPHLFRQRSNFRYLTGISDPNAGLLLSVETPGFRVKSTVFYEKTNEDIRIWEGKRLDSQSAIDISAADDAKPIDHFASMLTNLGRSKTSFQVWFDDYNIGIGMPPIPSQIREIPPAGLGNVRSISSHIHRLRVVKSSNELKAIRHACRAAANAMVTTMQYTSQAVAEFSFESVFEHSVKTRYGCRRLSFPPVVAAGDNATALHYLTNESLLQRGQLVLMDAGCEYHGYCSDMCRVWPVGGTFSGPQRSLYEALVSVHKQCLNMIKPGISLDHVYTEMLGLIGSVVKELGIIK